MLTKESVDALVIKLNAELNLPFATEGQEARIIRWAVNLVSVVLPEWVVPFLESAVDGLSPLDILQHEETLVTELNKLIDIPYIPEVMETAVIRPVVHAILEYALIDKQLPGV